MNFSNTISYSSFLLVFLLLFNCSNTENSATKTPDKKLSQPAKISNSKVNTPANTNSLVKSTKQSSDYNPNYQAIKAIDNIKDHKNSFTHTKKDKNAWWEIELNKIQSVESIIIWNRKGFESRLKNFHLITSHKPFTSQNLDSTLNQENVNSVFINDVKSKYKIPVNTDIKFLRIQLSGTNYLNLTEVEINLK